MNLITIIGGFVSAAGGLCAAGRLHVERRKKPEPVVQLNLTDLPQIEESYRREIVSAAIEQYHLERAEADKHNRPLSKTLTRIGYIGAALALIGASLTLYSGFTTFDTSWSSLGSKQITVIASSLHNIEAEPVAIGCAGAYCDGLAKDLKSAFIKAGWADISYKMSGGLGIDGIVGIRIDPMDDRTEAIAKAIEHATQLKIIRADDPRHPSYPPGMHLVVGTKPVD